MFVDYIVCGLIYVFGYIGVNSYASNEASGLDQAFIDKGLANASELI